VKKKLSIVLAVVLALSISLTSVTFAAGGKKEIALAQEAGQAWLDRTVELTNEPLDWIGAQLMAPQVCYGLDGQPSAYMFAMENDSEVVGYIIVGSSDYNYPMFEAADVPPPSIPSADEAKSILQKDLGLKVAKIGTPTRLLYLGFDNLFAVYQAGGQEVAVNLIADFAMPSSNLKTVVPSPEEYKARVEATEQSKPELLRGGAKVILDMSYFKYEEKEWCGPCSGTSIGRYYREKVDRDEDGNPDYPDLPANCTRWNSCYTPMYDALVDSWGLSHPILPPIYGNGFEDMTSDSGYNNFHHSSDYWVTGGDYWNRVIDINHGWPVAIYSNNFYYLDDPDPDWPHWVAMRGYEYPHEEIEHAIICTDSWRETNRLWLNFDHLGFGVVTVTIKDN